ncbi:MAG: substrate-binding domain-containing protein, partial [Pirellulales bacterium]
NTRHVAVMLDLGWALKRHTAVFSGTQRFAQEHGWTTTVDEFARDTLLAATANPVPYDGIIARASKRLAEQAARHNVPLVNVWLSSPARDMLPGVFGDFAAAGRMRAEHLLDRGLRNFAALISRRDFAHQLEVREFQRLAREAGGSCSTARISLDPYRNQDAWRRTVQIISDWMDGWRLPIGVYVGADQMGRYVAQACLQRRWRVPQDVALISGSNEEAYCLHPRPSLTSVEMGYERIGYEAARLLNRLMDKESTGRKDRANTQPKHFLVPPHALVVRESTDFFAVDDELIAAAMEFISANSARPIGPEDVAQAVTTELRTLQRRFRACVDRSIAAEIRRVRIERAKRELAQTDVPMKSIAQNAGFVDPKQMYQVFRRDVGITPTEYRQQRRVVTTPGSLPQSCTADRRQVI